MPRRQKLNMPGSRKKRAPPKPKEPAPVVDTSFEDESPITEESSNASPPPTRRTTRKRKAAVESSEESPRVKKTPKKANRNSNTKNKKNEEEGEEGGDGRVEELEKEVKMWREKYEKLHGLRETEPEALLAKSLKKLEAHQTKANKFIYQLKEENQRLESKAKKDDEEKEVKGNGKEGGGEGESHLLQFFQDITGMKVTYCEDFELETKELDRRFSTATLERQTKPYKCLVENEGSSVSFLIWIEHDQIEYRPLSVKLAGGKTPPAFFLEEIVFELEMGPSFLTQLFNEVYGSDGEGEE